VLTGPSLCFAEMLCPGVHLARGRSMDQVELRQEDCVLQKQKSVLLHELVGIVGLRVDVHAGHIKACRCVPIRGHPCTAVKVK